MTFDQIIIWIAAIGVLLGAADYICGNRLGLGEKFEEGFKSMGPLALGMTGIICLTPVIARYAGPMISPFFRMIGADPAVVGSFLAIDMGGYPLAMALADQEAAGLYSGAIVSSTLGCTLTFCIPVGFSMINRENFSGYSEGLLWGLIAIPFGSLIGGLAAGYNVVMLLWNTLPIFVVSMLLAWGMKRIPEKMTSGCVIFGKILTAVIYAGLAAAAFEKLTGVVLIPGMDPIGEGLKAVCDIGVILLGIFPVLGVFTGLLSKPLSAAGKKIGFRDTDTAGMIFTMATVVAVFPMIKDMSKKGGVLNAAWLVSAASVFGDHLGYLAGVNRSMIFPMVVGKLAGGVLGVLLAARAVKHRSDLEKID
ncbi:MAG: ethanolamine utilization protein EutH [Eubacteriales bacterium]|nr:ethanolamine utilization protein EutH [Eubacteriales bacterium]